MHCQKLIPLLIGQVTVSSHFLQAYKFVFLFLKPTSVCSIPGPFSWLCILDYRSKQKRKPSKTSLNILRNIMKFVWTFSHFPPPLFKFSLKQGLLSPTLALNSCLYYSSTGITGQFMVFENRHYSWPIYLKNLQVGCTMYVELLFFQGLVWID